MKKLILLIFATVMLAGCSEGTDNTERKESITDEEIMDYFGSLLESQIESFEMETIESEEDKMKVAEGINENATSVERELKKNYDKDINVVSDLIELAESLQILSIAMIEDDEESIDVHSNDVANQSYEIAAEYLDGEMPENYTAFFGIYNVLDIEGNEDARNKNTKNKNASISKEETTDYLDRLLKSHIEISYAETEEEFYEVTEWIYDNASNIEKELMKNYEKDINAVDELINLAELFQLFSVAMNEANEESFETLGLEVSRQAQVIIIDYLDGEFPKEFAEFTGIDSVDDIEDTFN